MKTLLKLVLPLVLFCILPQIVFAQLPQKELSFKTRVFTIEYYEGTDPISYKEFINKLNQNKEAVKLFNQGKNLSFAGNIIGCVGAFCFGYDLGTRIAGGDGSDGLLVGGGIVMVGGLVMYFVGNGKVKKALTIYSKDQKNLSFNLNADGIGLCLRF